MASRQERVREANRQVVGALEPKAFWDVFQEIAMIPRPSKHEERMGEFLVKFATDRNVEVKKDGVGNVLMTIPASNADLADKPMITFQVHQDMVCEKLAEHEHDFSTDPIEFEILEEEGRRWIQTPKNCTTLGADNGVGVGMSLVLVDEHESYPHGRIAFLFTTDEEEGMNGVFGMEEGWFDGDFLVNLDCEDWGELFVGCAGGGDATIRLHIDTEPVDAQFNLCRAVKVSGLRGGHSGCDIHVERCNCIKLLATFLKHLSEEIDYRVSDFSVISKYNAIPRDGLIHVCLKQEDEEKFNAVLKKVFDLAMVEYKSVDPDIAMEPLPADLPLAVWTKGFSDLVVRVIYALPHGVVRKSHDLEGGIVETSTNLANVMIKEGDIFLGNCSRSFIYEKIDEVRAQISAIAELAGGVAEMGKPYPGWLPDMDSRILAIARDSYASLHGAPPRILAIHAGLECGLLMQKKPDIECIALGPTIQNPHTPRERMDVDTVGVCFEWVKDIVLKALAE